MLPRIFALYLRLFAVVFLALASAVSIPPASAQPAGLPGAPWLGDSFQDLQKIATICDKCKEAEAASQAQIDRYNAARTTYEEEAARMRALADRFLEAKATFDRLNALDEQLSQESLDLLFDKIEAPERTYQEVQDALYQLEPDLAAARSALAEARAALDTGLRGLERLRLTALAELRSAIRLQNAMHQCEFACDIWELKLEEPEPDPNPPRRPGDINASEIPVPENFIGVVAKCAKCQPLAERVNQIRSHRRSFATSAQMLYASLTANQQTLDRLFAEAQQLVQQEKALYQALLASFTGTAPAEEADRIDQIFDARDQREAEERLRALAERRAQLARDMAGLEATIAQQFQGLLEAIANYRIHSQLLTLAQAELAACEATCTPAEEGPKTGLPDPFTDPDYPQPENVDPITAACAKCQPIADSLMQVLSDRRRVGGDIQNMVWLLKGRRASLERWQTEDDKLAAEERLLGAALLPSAGTNNPDQVLDRLFEIEAERTQLLSDMLWAEEEITRLQTQLEAALKEHEALTRRAADLRAQLAACERTCSEEDSKDISTGGGLYDPDYPQPESFIGVVAQCAACQPLAEALNALLSERYRLAGDIQSTAARLKHNEPLLDQRRADLARLEAREMALLPIWSQLDDSPEQRAAEKELNEIDPARRAAEADVAALERLNAQDRAVLEEMLAQHALLNQKIADARAALAACEAKKCTGAEDTTGTSLTDPTEGGSGQDRRFATTDCAPCEPVVSLLNDVIGSLITTKEMLAEKRAALAALEAEMTQMEADKSAAQDAFASALTRRNAQRDAGQDTSATETEMQQALDRAGDLLSDIEDGEIRRLDLQDEIEALETRLTALEQQETTLRAQLAECEKQCVAAEDTTGTSLTDPSEGGSGQDSRFATTDCAPCEPVVSLLNDVIGSLITTKEMLAEKRAALAALEAEMTQMEADKSAAQDAFASALTRRNAQRDAGQDTSATETEMQQALDRAGDLLSDIEYGEIRRLDLQDEIEALETRLTALEQQETTLRAQLAECEKQCVAAEDTTGTSLTDPSEGDSGQGSRFATTDCVPCEPVVSLLNDVIGSLITTRETLAEKRAALAALEAEMSQMEADKSAAQDAFASALTRRNAQRDAGQDTSAAETEMQQALDRAGDLLSDIEDGEIRRLDLQDEIEAQETRLTALEQQEATLRAQLAECEKQCVAAEDTTGTSLTDPSEGGSGQDSRFAATDCAPCEPVVSLLNDVIGSLITTKEMLAEKRAALAALEAEMTQMEADKSAAQDAFASALTRRNAQRDAGQDTSATETEMQQALDRAGDLLSDIEDGEIRRLDLQDEIEALETRLAALEQQEATLRAQLAECEKQCVAADDQSAVSLPNDPPVTRPPTAEEILLEKLQQGSCRGGGNCDFDIRVTNSSDRAHSGPLFLTENGRVAAGANGAQFGAFHCSPARGGTTMCLHESGLAAGETVAMTLPIRLPRRGANGAENCVEVTVTRDGRVLVQLVQLGLAARGFQPGSVDGVVGPRTRRALAGLAAETGQELSMNDPAAAYAALFGSAPVAMTAGSPGCTVMEVAPAPRSSTPRSTPKSTPEPKPEEEKRNPLMPTIRFGITIGGGHSSPSESYPSEY